jgi:hypothetical protein
MGDAFQQDLGIFFDLKAIPAKRDALFGKMVFFADRDQDDSDRQIAAIAEQRCAAKARVRLFGFAETGEAGGAGASQVELAALPAGGSEAERQGEIGIRNQGAWVWDSDVILYR